MDIMSWSTMEVGASIGSEALCGALGFCDLGLSTGIYMSQDSHVYE